MQESATPTAPSEIDPGVVWHTTARQGPLGLIALGVTLAVAWWITRWTWLLLAGGLLVAVLPVVLAAVLLCSANGVRRSRRRGVARWSPFVGVVALALLAGGTAAASCAVVHVEWTRYRVVFTNEAATPWRGDALHGGGVVVVVPDLAAGATWHVDVWFTHDGSLQFGNGRVLVEGYVTNDMGGAAHVVRERSERVRVEHRPQAW